MGVLGAASSRSLSTAPELFIVRAPDAKAHSQGWKACGTAAATCPDMLCSAGPCGQTHHNATRAARCACRSLTLTIRPAPTAAGKTEMTNMMMAHVSGLGLAALSTTPNKPVSQAAVNKPAGTSWTIETTILVGVCHYLCLPRCQ